MKNGLTPTPAVFLDRDGVIIHNRSSYILDSQQVKIYGSAIQALQMLSSLPFKIILVSNQSAVGRGLLSLKKMQDIQVDLEDSLRKNNIHISDTFICPHHPDSRCDCRKPRPGLILKASQKHKIDLEKSWIVGDAYSDIEAGYNAGIKNTVLVCTGRGNRQLTLYRKINPVQPSWVARDLLQAVQYIKK